MGIEAVVLTGGASRRMGEDKARLVVDGEPLAERTVRLLSEAAIPCTTLGREPTPGAEFLPDEGQFKGPLTALSRFRPRADFVFVCSCDLPRFDARLVEALESAIGEADAAAPFVDGFRQPLCALYRASAFANIPARETCAMSWLDSVETVLVSEEDLRARGVHPDATRGANTPEELQTLLGNRA